MQGVLSYLQYVKSHPSDGHKDHIMTSELPWKRSYRGLAPWSLGLQYTRRLGVHCLFKDPVDFPFAFCLNSDSRAETVYMHCHSVADVSRSINGHM